MRVPFALLAAAAFFTASAQFDINKMMQEKMAKQGQGSGQPSDGSGVKMEDDNDPFVPNTFTGSFRMETHRYKSSGSGTAVAYTEVKDSPSNLFYWSRPDMTLMRSETPSQKKGQDMRILTDLKGKWSYMLMTDEEGKKTAMKSKKKKVVMTDAKEGRKPEVNITGETRTIDGHLCKKVIVTSEQGTWTGWVAEDLPAPFGDMARHIKTADGDMSQRLGQIQGFPLEYEWVSADGKDRMVSYVKEVVTGSVDESVFSLDGYEVMDMPGFGH